MSGCFSGVQAGLKEPHFSSTAATTPLTWHCRRWSERCPLQQTRFIFKKSTKCKTTLESFFGEGDIKCNILGLCATRLCIRTNTISRVSRAYGPLLQTVHTLQQDHSVCGETRAKISGLLKEARKARMVFGLVCSEVLFGPCKTVAKVLQGEKATAAGALECVKTVKESMHALCEVKAVEGIVNKTKASAATRPQNAR